MIRVVPGANVGPGGAAGEVTPGSAVGVAASSDPSTSAITRTTTSATTDSAATRPFGNGRSGRSGEASVPEDDVAAGFGAGGASTGERCTATPGPAGVGRAGHPRPAPPWARAGLSARAGAQP